MLGILCSTSLYASAEQRNLTISKKTREPSVQLDCMYSKLLICCRIVSLTNRAYVLLIEKLMFLPHDLFDSPSHDKIEVLQTSGDINECTRIFSSQTSRLLRAVLP